MTSNLTDKKTVSHSEADCFTRCETLHWFAYGLEKTPKKVQDHLQIGTATHKMLEAYYKQMIPSWKGFEDGIDAALEVYVKMVAERKIPYHCLLIARKLFDRYVDEYDPREWEILVVEGYYSYPVNIELEFNFQVDLVVRPRRKVSKYYGQLGVVDHKTTLNFMTFPELRMHSQLPKYIYALNDLNVFEEKITHGIINQLRTREIKDYDPDKVFNRYERDWTETHQAAFLEAYERTAMRILDKRQIPIGMWRKASSLALTKDICKWCDFAGPCEEYLMGSRAVANTLRVYYTTRDTSYREERILLNGPKEAG